MTISYNKICILITYFVLLWISINHTLYTKLIQQSSCLRIVLFSDVIHLYNRSTIKPMYGVWGRHWNVKCYTRSDSPYNKREKISNSKNAFKMLNNENIHNFLMQFSMEFSKVILNTFRNLYCAIVSELYVLHILDGMINGNTYNIKWNIYLVLYCCWQKFTFQIIAAKVCLGTRIHMTFCDPEKATHRLWLHFVYVLCCDIFISAI